MMKWTAVAFALMLLVLGGCSAQQTNSTSETVLCGVWYTNPTPPDTVTEQFPWGIGKTVVNAAVVIDTTTEPNTIIIPVMGGPFRITKLESISNNVFALSFYFDRGKFEVNYVVHYQPTTQTIWFEDIGHRGFIQPSAASGLWYKISGPDTNDAADYGEQTRRGVITTDNLRVRSTPTLMGAQIGYVNTEDQIAILTETSSTSTVDGITAPWYHIRTDSDIEGWVFGGYVRVEHPTR